MDESGPPPSVAVQLAVISTKLDTLLVQRDDHEARIRAIEAAKPEDHEPRIRKLEQFRWVLAGAVAAGSTAGTALVARVIGA